MKGKAVPYKVWCDLDGVEMIAIVTAKNRHPLNTYVSLFEADGYYSTRLRMEQTSTVTPMSKLAASCTQLLGDNYPVRSVLPHIKIVLLGTGSPHQNKRTPRIRLRQCLSDFVTT
jgi:hypothetical protein